MIDSGATGNFVNERIVRTHTLPTEALSTPKPLTVVDGRPIAAGTVTQRTPELPMTIKGRATEISLLVTSIGKHEIILGLPWLERHNPTVNWTGRELSWDDGIDESETRFTEPKELDEPPSISAITIEDVTNLDPDDIDACLLINVTINTEADVEVSALDSSDARYNHQVPPEFKEFLDVFSKKNADTLPEHTKFDHQSK